MSNPDTTKINVERLVIIGGALIIVSIIYKYVFNRGLSILEFVLFICFIYIAIHNFYRYQQKRTIGSALISITD